MKDTHINDTQQQRYERLPFKCKKRFERHTYERHTQKSL